MGIKPALGRLVNEDDDQPGAAAVLAVSYAFWRKNFGGDADAVGTPILIAGKPFLVSGVTPPEFFGVRPQSLPDFYIPVHDLPLVNQDRYRDTNAYFADDHTYWIEMMGRFKPSFSFTSAQSELSSLFSHWVSGTARTEHDCKTLPRLQLEAGGSGVDSLRRRYSKPLALLMWMVALILTIACANTANLLLAKAARRGEKSPSE